MTLIDKAEALLPCPFCTEGKTVSNYFDHEQGDKWGYASCDACGARGPEVRTRYDRNDNAQWRAEAIAAWNRRAIPARGVGVPANVKDYAIDVSEAYDTMMEVQRNPAGAWQVIQALAGHIAALSPAAQPGADVAVQAREAAMQELIDAYQDIIDYGPLVLAKKDQWARVKAAKEKLKEART